MKELGIYVHIPFCVHKCLYCDFYSMPADDSVKSAYAESVITQIGAESEKYRDNYHVVSIFLGGGTPSTMDTVLIRRIIRAIRDGFLVDEDCEISIECNPATVDAGILREYRATGINRISLGLQSANDEELRAIGRIHDFKDFMKTYEAVMLAGFNNVNVDIMSSLPMQTAASYRKTLRTVCALRPSHISAYSLILEENTPLYDMYNRGQIKLCDEDEDRRLYYLTGEELSRAGYERYEISNYARDNKRCRHNVNYWRRTDYLGIGVGASSLIKNTRYDIEKDIRHYIENPLGCYVNSNELSISEQMSEFMFLGLRMTKGVREDDFRRNFGRHMYNVYGDVIDRYSASGHLVFENGNLRLTPKGVDVSNYIFSDFIL